MHETLGGPDGPALSDCFGRADVAAAAHRVWELVLWRRARHFMAEGVHHISGMGLLGLAGGDGARASAVAVHADCNCRTPARCPTAIVCARNHRLLLSGEPLACGGPIPALRDF